MTKLNFVKIENIDSSYRFKSTQWFDTDAFETKWGVQAKTGNSPWGHVIYKPDGQDIYEPIIFDTEDEATKKIEEFKEFA